MVEDYLLAGAAIGSGGCGANSGSGGAVPIQLAATDWPDLSWHRAVCVAAPLDGARLDPLLHLLPGLVYFLRIPLHRKIQRVCLDDLLGQRRGRAAPGCF